MAREGESRSGEAGGAKTVPNENIDRGKPYIAESWKEEPYFSAIRTSEIDTNQYFSYRLANGIEVLLVNNSTFSKVACAVSVGVGSFDEPVEWPGLAHFLEHMLFMGTEKYPKENEFGNFISIHNGENNAYTADEKTVYYCDVDAEHGETMIDMLAWFFIGPLFVKDSVAREISAVDSEFQHSKNSFYARLDPLLALFNRPGERRGAFSYGNNETLQKEGILEAVIDFWKKAYSSEKMKVAVCGNAGIEKLREWASVFEGVEKRVQEDDSHRNGRQEEPCGHILIDRAHLGTVIHAKPNDSKKHMVVVVDMPPSIRHFRKNPYRFLSFLLTSPEKGSFLYNLKDRGLGSSVKMHFRPCKTFTRVSIYVELTMEGIEMWETVTGALSSLFRKYLNIVTGSGDMCSEPKSYLEENDQDSLCEGHEAIEEADQSDINYIRKEYERYSKKMKDELRFMEQDEPLDMVESFADALQDYPVENVIDWSFLAEEYDPLLLKGILEDLGDSKKWLVILSYPVETPDLFTDKEKYYGVEYRIVKRQLEHTLEADWFEIPANTGCFYHNSFDLVISGHPDGLARYIAQDLSDSSDLVYVFDSEFRVPKSEVSIVLWNRQLCNSLSILELYLSLVRESFSESNARLLCDAHVNVSADTFYSAASLTLGGFSERMPEIAANLVSSLNEVDIRRFEVMKQKIIDDYEYSLKRSPICRLVDVFYRHIFRLQSVEEMLEAARSIRPGDMKLTNVYSVDIIAVGNIGRECVENIAATTTSSLQVSKRTQTLYEPVNWDVLLTGGETDDKNRDFLRLSFKTYDKVNKATGIFFHVASFGESKRRCACYYAREVGCDECLVDFMNKVAVGGMFHQISEDDFFNELRTEEELGYCVSAGLVDLGDSQYLEFRVQSERDTGFLEKRILRFIDDLKVRISELSQEEFETFKESLVGSYKEPIVNVGGLKDTIMKQYERHREVQLDYNEKMISRIQQLEKKDLVNSRMLDSYVVVNSVTD